MMPMRPSGTTANPIILLYNTISHFTSLAFGNQHQIPTQQHQGYNTITWIFSKKTKYLLTASFQSPIPLAKMKPMRPFNTTAKHFLLLCNTIYHFTSLAFGIQHQILTTYSAAPRYNSLYIFKKKTTYLLTASFQSPILLAKMMPIRPSGTTANPLISLYNMLSHFTSLAFDIQHQIPTQQHQGYNTITWIFSKKNEILAYCIISITNPIGQNDAYATLWNHCKPYHFTL